MFEINLGFPASTLSGCSRRVYQEALRNVRAKHARKKRVSKAFQRPGALQSSDFILTAWITTRPACFAHCASHEPLKNKKRKNESDFCDLQVGAFCWMWWSLQIWAPVPFFFASKGHHTDTPVWREKTAAPGATIYNFFWTPFWHTLYLRLNVKKEEEKTTPFNRK